MSSCWKFGKHPLIVQRQSRNESRVNTRADTTEKPLNIGRSLMKQKTCVSDAIRLWNMAPENITTCTSQTLAKSEIKKFVRQLPI